MSTSFRIPQSSIFSLNITHSWFSCTPQWCNMAKESPATTDFSPKGNSGSGFRHITTSPTTSGTPGQSLLSAHTLLLGMWMLKGVLLAVLNIYISLKGHVWVGVVGWVTPYFTLQLHFYQSKFFVLKMTGDKLQQKAKSKAKIILTDSEA